MDPVLWHNIYNSTLKIPITLSNWLTRMPDSHTESLHGISWKLLALVWSYNSAKSSYPDRQKWAIIDSTLCILAFYGHRRSSVDQCCDCSSSHQSYHECSLGKNPRKVTNPASFQPRQPPSVCFQWNRGNCPFQCCKYVHKCSFCVTNPRATDAAHKVINCPYHPDRYPLSSPQDKPYPRTTPK